MLGMRTRLGSAKTLVWVGLQDHPRTLSALVGQLCTARADLVVLTQPDARPDDLLLGHRAAQQASDGRVLLGLAGEARLTGRANADLVAAKASEVRERIHEHSLNLAVVTSPAHLRAALTDDRVDALVLTPELVVDAVLSAPPSQRGSRPWFVQVASLEQAREVIKAGARRLAFDLAVVSRSRPQSTAGQLVADFRDELLTSWQADMGEVAMGAFRLGDTDQPGGLT